MKIQDSLQQVLASQTMFGELFYPTLFRRCPAAQQYFQDVNLQRQSVLLTMALVVIEKQYSSPFSAAEEYLKYLGSKHHARQIPQSLYADWLEAMLETLATFHGEQWDDLLEQQWRDAVNQVIGFMFEGYQQHFTV